MTKKKNNNTSWSIGLIVIVVLSVWGVYTFGNWQGTAADNASNKEVVEESTVEVQQEQTRNENVTYSGWIPSWASVVGYSTVLAEKGLFDDISPVWYEVKTNGELEDIRPSNAGETVELTRDNDIELIPSIAMFDHELFTEVLQDQENLDRHVDSIHQEVMDQDYDGIDLDYESTKRSDKDKYFEFLEKLSEKMKADEKKLVVTVLAKWGDDIEYPYLPQTRDVQDWSEIAKYADEIRIMTYDYTSASALNPGPIAPLYWMQEVIDYAKTEADPSKFVLGVHLYSYERWVEVTNPNSDQGFDDPRLRFKEKFFQNNESGEFPARSYGYDVVQGVVDSNSGQTEEYEGEQIFRYSKINSQTGIYENRVLVYINEEGVEQRIDLAKENGLKGVAFWQLGSGSALLEGLDKKTETKSE